MSTPLVFPEKEAFHFQRRVFHLIGGSLFPILAMVLEWETVFRLLLISSALLVSSDALRLHIIPLNTWVLRLGKVLLRSGEQYRLTGASYLLLGTLSAFVFFEQDIAILAVLFLAFGDPAAAVVGQRLGKGWFYGKSPFGTMGMVAVSLAVIATLHGVGAIEFKWIFVAGALIAALVELLPLPVNDNFTIPMSAGVIMVLLGG